MLEKGESSEKTFLSVNSHANNSLNFMPKKGKSADNASGKKIK